MRRPTAPAVFATLLAGATLSVAAGRAPLGAPLDPSLSGALVQIEASLAKLRGIPFKHDVKTAAMTHEEARAYVRTLLHEEYPGEGLAAEQDSLRYFALLGSDENLEAIYLNLMEAQVAGLYDPEARTLYVVEGPLSGAVALAHELAHALMDQTFDLDALEKRAMDDDDRALALSSLVEGEATMVMTLWAMEHAADPNLASLGGADGDAAMKASQNGLEAAPPFLRDLLVFPYVQGMSWAAEIMKKGGGLRALDEYFKAPPESSEQILHPAKSMAPRDVPSGIDASLAGAGLPGGTEIVKSGSLGEFGIRFLFGAGGAEAAEAAAGWDGDRFVLAREAGASHLNWVSVWDTENDAAEFAAAARSWLAGRNAARGPAEVRVKGTVVLLAEGGEAARRVDLMASRTAAGVHLR
ncbi:MAG TPA: hypothetical protein VE404_03345 [Verrucomicrobiae bacterium]|nr:hypothetical protein [Verrucomicrobiae bacterium]